MNRASFYAALAGVALAGVAALAISAAVDSPRSLMAPVDYDRARRAIESDTRLALGQCRGLDGRDRTLCQARARAGERVRKADLRAAYLGTVNAASEARIARVKARFDVARAQCSESRGLDRLACLRQARAEKSKASAEEKVAAAS